MIALGGLALAGAGLVVTVQPRAADAVAWLQRHTEAAAGLLVGADAGADVAEQAAEDGFDVLEAPLEAPAAHAWPSDRVLLALVRAPRDSEGTEGDELLEALQVMAEGRPLVAGVTLARGGHAADALMFCDRVVEELGLICAAVDLLRDDDAVLTAVLAGRVHLVQGVPSLVSDRWESGPAALTVPAVSGS